MDPNTLTALLTSAILVLTAIAIIVGILAIFAAVVARGWVKNAIAKRVEESVNYAKLEDVGRARSFIGYVFGRLRHVDLRYLDEAIKFSRDAYDELPDNSPHKDMAMNNWAFYVSLKADPADAAEAMQIGTQLRNRYPRTRDPDDVNTYASIVAAYYDRYDDPRAAVDDALELVKTMIQDDSVAEADKANARRHRDRLMKASAK